MKRKPPRVKKSVPGLGKYDYEDYDALIEAIGEQTAMVAVDGRVQYIRVPEFSRGELKFYTQSDIRAWLGRYKFLYDLNKSKPGFDLWLTSEKANRFEGVEFRPDEDRIIIYDDGRETLNRFVGLSPDLDPNDTGTYDLFLEHLELNICGGNRVLFEFCLDWIAQLLQHPETKSGVAILCRGDKGTGKSIFSNVVARLVGKRYCTMVDSPESFLGRFNGHLADALLIQFEEGYFAGNPAHVGRLNNFITGETILVERKNQEAYTARHYARVIMTSNADYVAPATGGERRFVVLDCASTRKQDTKFFGALLKELEDGGYGRLFHDLSKRDLTGRDWGNPPMTAGLSTQIRHNMKPDEGWWTDLLTTGCVAFAKTPDCLQNDSMEWALDEAFVVERDALYQSFRQFAPGFKAPPSQAELGRFLKKVCPTIGSRRMGGKGQQSYCYVLPPRQEALTSFMDARPGLVLENEATASAAMGGICGDQGSQVVPFTAAAIRRAA